MLKWVIGLCAAMYGVLMIFGEPTPEELAVREARENQQVTRAATTQLDTQDLTESANLEASLETEDSASEPAIARTAEPAQSIESPTLASAPTDTTTPAAPASVEVETLTIAPATTQAEPETTKQASAALGNEIWRVTASAVNLRAGPSTNNRVVGRATQNDSAEIIEMLPSGWAKVYILETGTEAFMSAQFLAAPD